MSGILTRFKFMAGNRSHKRLRDIKEDLFYEVVRIIMFKKSGKANLLLIAGLILWFLFSIVYLPPAWSQTGVQFETVSPENSVKQEPGENEIAMGRLQKSLDAARQDLQNTKSFLESTSPNQIGATPQEVNQKIWLLKRKISFYEQYVDAYRTIDEISQAAHFYPDTDKGLERYGKGPPYAVTVVDQLRDDIYDLNLKIDEKTALKTFLLQNQEDARDELKTSEQKLRLSTEALERRRSSENPLRLKWLRELSLLGNEVARVRVLVLKKQLETTDAIIAFNRKELALLEQYFERVSSDVAFTKQDLDRKLTAIKKEKEQLETLYSEATERDKVNQEKLRQARQALLAGKASDLAGNSVARRQLEVFQAWADTSSQIADMYFIILSGLDVEKILWEERYLLANDRDSVELKKAADRLEIIISRLREFQAYTSSSLELSQSLVANQQRRAEADAISEEEQVFVLEILEAYQARADFLSQNIPKTNDVIRNTERFLNEVRGHRKRLTITERIAGLFDHGGAFLVSFWNYELFAVDDTIFIDGEKVTGQRAVTIGKILTALMILIIGFLLSTPLKNKIGAISARHFKVAAPGVILIEKIFIIIVFISLVIFALMTVKIPLTVFAFMGGALAIGVGFGAQNLINNFISGIILLMEQPIKVDDIIEIDGMSGTVVSVGARCSQVRRFDGIDILVPNSEFLQKNVVNWTLSDSQLRLTIKFGVAYGSHTRNVSQIVSRVLEEHGRILKNPAPCILFDDFGDSALIFTVYFWVNIDPEMTYRIIASDFRHMLGKRLDESGIVIAFPQHDVHLDAGKPIQVSLVPCSATSGDENG